MPKIGEGTGKTYGQLRDIASGKVKGVVLTPEEQGQVKQIQEQTEKLGKSFLSALPDTSAISNLLKSVSEPIHIDTSWMAAESQAKAEQRALNKMMLDELRAKKQQQSQLINPVFDFYKSEIHFAGKVTKIPKNTNQFYVCKAVFSDPTKNWSWDEIVEKMGDSPEEIKNRAIYSAAREVNKRVAIETGVKDLLVITMTTVAINPHYLKV